MRTAREMLKELFKGLPKQDIIKALEMLKNRIPTKTPEKELKQLEMLKPFLPKEAYQEAKNQILKSLNGFKPEEIEKLRYYHNVITTLIKALE